MSRIIDVEKSFIWHNEITARVGSVMRMFGLDLKRVKEEVGVHRCSFTIDPGQVCFFAGASGSGKSVLLKEVYQSFCDDEKIWLQNIPIENGNTVIDCFDGEIVSALRNLSKAGLNDVFTILNRPSCLSDGQKYRYRLAKALASDKKFIFIDEFCSNLDRITASVISSNIRKLADRTGRVFFLAAANEDVLADLLPDVLIIKHIAGEAEVIYRNRD